MSMTVAKLALSSKLIPSQTILASCCYIISDTIGLVLSSNGHT